MKRPHARLAFEAERRGETPRVEADEQPAVDVDDRTLCCSLRAILGLGAGIL